MSELDATRRAIKRIRSHRRRIARSLVVRGQAVDLNTLLAALNNQAPVDPDLPTKLGKLVAEVSGLVADNKRVGG